VCLVDDDVSMLRAVGRLLSAAGFTVHKFSEPAAFLTRMEEAECPVVVLDVWMPEISGLEVQATLRKKSPHTRVIFMSGRDDPSVRQHALQAGAFGFLLKPFKDEDLVGLIERAIAAP
jgi:two-component system response regulator FixJ